LVIGQHLAASVRWLPIEQESQESCIQHTLIERQKRIAARCAREGGADKRAAAIALAGIKRTPGQIAATYG